MRVFVGTSGWFYEWNEERTLDWYIADSGLNAVELNASFYRFPFPNMVRSWANKGKKLAWAVKVNRTVTHTHRFNAGALAPWKRFRRLFEPLDSQIHFYLFQLHPMIAFGQAERVERFARATELGSRFALEPRHESWFRAGAADWACELGLTLVAVDSPSLARTVANTSGSVYVRMHGRTGWYHHDYTAGELRGVAVKVRNAKPDAAYVFFNNDSNMLPNARAMYRIAAGRSGEL